MNTGQTSCKLCKYPGSDLRFLGCGCAIHSRCMPMDLVLDMREGNENHISILPAANTSSHLKCPICQSESVGRILIEPLCFKDVEHAIALKKNELPSLATNRSNLEKQQSRKHPREDDIEIQAESPYLLLSNGNSSISCSGLSRGQQRTGRWTNEESALVEFLVTTFDQGLLPLPHGIKLNEFLGDILLCKSSRLTKKMKNAKLSTRSFVLGKPCAKFTAKDREKLSMLQENFLASLTSESTRLVLKLNLTKQWRTHFYNICLQIGYPHLQERAWNSSLQELERRASKAEEIVRSIRRRKMGLNPQFNGGNFVNPNPVFEVIKTYQSKIDPKMSDINETIVSNVSEYRSNSHVSIVSNKQKIRTISTNEEESSNINYDGGVLQNCTSNGHHGRRRTLSTDISISSVGLKTGRSRSLSEDFDALLDVLTEETAEVDNSTKGKATTVDRGPKSASNFSEPLLQSVVNFMESNKLPFHHVDLWVPSFSSGVSEGCSKSVDIDKLNLYHAGFKFRHDVSEETARMLQEFGVYSSYFSFEPGNGLPGRVFASGVISWECEVQNRDPNDFHRVEGAELYGVKTALAIPLNTAIVGRIVVQLYSCENIPEDTSLARNIATELTKYSLEPKWELVFDSKGSSEDQNSKNLLQQDMASAEDHSTKCVPNFSDMSNINDSIGDSNINRKEPDTVISSCSSMSTSEIVKTQQMATVPDAGGFDKLQHPNDVQVTHYLHRVNVGVFDSEVGQDDNEFASFLHRNMPVADESGNVATSSDTKTLRPYFLSFISLLLNPSNERSTRENEIIEILKKSLRAYTRDNRRDGKQLANLLVKDWVCLKSTYSFDQTKIPRKESFNRDCHPLPITSMSHTLVKSSAVESYKAIPPVPPTIERQISSDYPSTTRLPSIHSVEPTPQQFVPDFSENISDQSSRVSESSSSSLRLLVDHKLYLERKSSLDSVQYTSSDV
mmetsp:Transcript_7546/g.18572  ORF Transcript_7546/g.18572 Transcript_7546/m.18572 type:complete len:957 (-) Transcript_7546:1100-3970(-)